MMDESYKEMDRVLRPEDYAAALMVQDACNLSGVVHTFSGIISKIWDEANARKEGTDWVNHHPICRLFAEQIAHLTGVGGPYFEAYAVCEKKSKETVVVEEDDGYPD